MRAVFDRDKHCLVLHRVSSRAASCYKSSVCPSPTETGPARIPQTGPWTRTLSVGQHSTHGRLKDIARSVLEPCLLRGVPCHLPPRLPSRLPCPNSSHPTPSAPSSLPDRSSAILIRFHSRLRSYPPSQLSCPLRRRPSLPHNLTATRAPAQSRASHRKPAQHNRGMLTPPRPCPPQPNSPSLHILEATHDLRQHLSIADECGTALASDAIPALELGFPSHERDPRRPRGCRQRYNQRTSLPIAALNPVGLLI